MKVHWPRCLVLTSEVTVMEVCMCHAKLEQFATVTKSLVTVPIYSWMLTKKKNYRYDERLYSSFSTGHKMMEQLILMHFL